MRSLVRYQELSDNRGGGSSSRILAKFGLCRTYQDGRWKSKLWWLRWQASWKLGQRESIVPCWERKLMGHNGRRKGRCWFGTEFEYGFIFFLRFSLFIHEGQREKEARDRKSRLHARSPMWDLIPGLWDHALSRRQMLNHWATQASQYSIICNWGRSPLSVYFYFIFFTTLCLCWVRLYTSEGNV